VDAAELNAGPIDLDEAVLQRLARVADRVLAAPPGFRHGPWQHPRRAGAGQEFLDFAAHVPGADARRIDWRASARAPRLLERRHLDASISEWCVCLDRSASMAAAGANKPRLAARLAAAMTYILLHREHAVAFVAFSDRIEDRCPPGRGRAHYARVLRRLARPGGDGRGSRLELCAAQVARRECVVVVSDFLAPDAMRVGLMRLLRRGGQVHALQVLDADECAPGVSGAALLGDAESEQVFAVADVQQAAHAAGRALARQQRELRAFCARHAIGFSVCLTGEAWQDVLLRHLSRTRRFDA
jgi:uncharacterized protein (DUF58 family)